MINKFDIRQGGFSDLFEEIFEGNSVHIEIDNRKTTCKKDIEVCCKMTSPPIRATTKPTPPPPLKCGIHNARGLEVTASFPSDGQAR